MPIREEQAKKILNFLQNSKMSKRLLGQQTTGNPNFIYNFLNNQDCLLSSLEKVEKFINEYSSQVKEQSYE